MSNPRRPVTSRRALTQEEHAIAAQLKAVIANTPGLTEERIGNEIGVTQGAVSHWTGARLAVPASRAQAVAEAFGIDDPCKVSLAYRKLVNKPQLKVAEEQPTYGERARFDPDKIAETVTALRIIFARRGEVYEISSPADAAIFVAAYALRESMPAVVAQADLVEQIARVVPINGNEDGRSDDRKTGRPHRRATDEKRTRENA